MNILTSENYPIEMKIVIILKISPLKREKGKLISAGYEQYYT